MEAIDLSKSVKSINGTAPDGSGNVAVNVGVETVNSTAPDKDGNLKLDVGVKTINSTAPDNNGNVKLEVADTTTASDDRSKKLALTEWVQGLSDNIQTWATNLFLKKYTFAKWYWSGSGITIDGFVHTYEDGYKVMVGTLTFPPNTKSLPLTYPVAFTGGLPNIVCNPVADSGIFTANPAGGYSQTACTIVVGTTIDISLSVNLIIQGY